MAVMLNKTQILDTAKRLHPAGLEKVTDKNAAVDGVAQELKATTPADKQLIRDTLTAFWASTNEQKGAAGAKATGHTVQKTVEAPVDNRTNSANLRAPGVPANVLNAVTPLLEKGALTNEQLTSGLARIHNDWFQKAKGDGYLLGERNKADPVMKMARSFFVEVEAKGGQLTLKLDDKEKAFVRDYGRKQAPGQTLTDEQALEAGSQKILGEIRGNNQGALDESLKLVTAHLAGDITRLAAGDYLDKVKGMSDVKVPEKKPSLAEPNKEKALELVNKRIADLDKFIGFLGGKGQEPVKRGDVPKDLHAAYDLMDEEHNRWVKQQLSWGATANADFVPTAELPASRLALDAAPLKGAYETLAAGLESGAITPEALNAILPLLEKGKLTADQLAQGLGLIHNAWFAQAKSDGYLLGERNKADPVMKMARSFFVPVEVKGSEISLKLAESDKPFVRDYGRKGAPETKMNDDQALKAGSDRIIGEIRNNNQGALDEGLKLITGHLAGNVVQIGMGNYLDDVKNMKPVELPTASSHPVSKEQAKEQVGKLLGQVDEFMEFLAKKGDATVSREETPAHLHKAYDLFAEEHDRWLAQQISWGSPPNQDWVHTSGLPAKRIMLDAAPIRGALLTLDAALG